MRIIRTNRGIVTLYSYEFIGKGTEATVYRKGSVAYKCYHPIFHTDRLDLEETERLEQLSTQRILLPRETIYGIRGKFQGYTTRYIEDYGLDNILHLSTDRLIQEFHLLKQDCATLGEHSIFVADFLPDESYYCNYLFHDGIYFFDPGKYYFDYHYDKDRITTYNSMMVDSVIYQGAILRVARRLMPPNQLHPYLQEFEWYRYHPTGKFTDFLESDMHDKNLEEYVKRKILKK